MNGFFLVVDGPSGIGKTTITGLLAGWLREVGHDVLPAREPSDGPAGTLARSSTHEFGGLALACLVAADRYWHLAHHILPALEAGKIVVCDRYVPSSLVLQQLDGVDPDYVATLNQHVLPPDLTVVLTGNPERSARRAAQRGGYSRFHGNPIEVHTREDRLYRTLVPTLRTAGWDVLHHDIADDSADDITTLILDTALPRMTGSR